MSSSDDVYATLNYTVEKSDPEEGRQEQGLGIVLDRELEGVTVQIFDGRFASGLKLDERGFKLCCHSSNVGDFFSEEKIRTLYYKEMEDLILKETCASRVKVFDHLVRSPFVDQSRLAEVRAPIYRIHNDYTERTAFEALQQLLPEEASKISLGRYALLQIWRPIRGTVLTSPLAVLDWSTLWFQDLTVVRKKFQGWASEDYGLIFSSRHRWFWFPRMTIDEVLLFKNFDSATDGCSRFTPHSAFEVRSETCLKQRESIEVRALVVFR